MIISRDEAFRIVCNIRTPKGAGKEAVGTGSFVGKGNDLYLLTAAHVATGTDRNTIIALGDEKSNCIRLPLVDIVEYLDWKYHPVADMAVLELNISKHREVFQNRFFPYDHINDKEVCASRDDELTVIGFPNGLGVQGKFSPLTFRSYASSSFMSLYRADKRDVLSDFFCLENPSVGGYSGAPILDLGYMVLGCATSTKEKTIMHGIMHGTMSDETGGKLALITPMYYIKDIV